MSPRGPLDGIRVVDLTTVVMGPFATQLLGDMGADVTKVESPDGDVFRYSGPAVNRGMSAAFLHLNRNKRSIVLDLKCPEDLQVLLDLVRAADVLVYSVRPQSMRRLGLDYDRLREGNPRLIYCGVYGFSENGAYAGRPAFDDTIQAMSGLAWLQGQGEPQGPQFVRTLIADKTAGLTAAYAISLALFERERSGCGQAIEVPMFETMVSFTMIEHLAGATFSPPRGAVGYDRILAVHRRPHRTTDGYIAVLPYTTEQWQRFFRLAGRPEYCDDPRVTDAASRSEHIDELYRLVAGILLERTTTEWMELLKAADIPATPVASPAEVIDDPHLRDINFFGVQTHESEGEIRTIGIPVHLARTPGSIRRLAPRLDEHREEILREAHASKDGRSAEHTG